MPPNKSLKPNAYRRDFQPHIASKGFEKCISPYWPGIGLAQALGRVSMEEQKMNTKQTASMLEDRKVNVKAKLALLWVALMFLYIYNDLFSLWQPGHVAELVEGQLEAYSSLKHSCSARPC